MQNFYYVIFNQNCYSFFYRLPVPETLKNSNKILPLNEYVDNPSLHGGKIRTFPHERGNWATYVFVPCKFVETFFNIFKKIMYFS